MNDDPNKRHVDGWFVSSQSYEIDYFIDSMHKEFPSKLRSAVSDELLKARKRLAPSEGREKLKEAVRRALRG